MGHVSRNDREDARKIAALASLLSALVAGIAGCGQEAEVEVWSADLPNPFTFRHAPPDGTRFVQSVFSRVNRVGEPFPRVLLETETEIEVTIRRAEAGTVMTEEYLSQRSTVNGDLFHDPTRELMVGTRLRHHFDAEGRLVAVDGLEDLARRSRELLPPDVAPAAHFVGGQMTFLPLGGAAHLLDQEQSHWQGRIGHLAGVTARVGDRLERTGPYLLGSRVGVPFVSQLEFPRFEPCPAGSCVRVWFDYRAEADALRRHLFDFVRDFAPTYMPGRPVPTVGESALSGSGSLLIDPRTLLVYEDTEENVATVTLDDPQLGVLASETTTLKRVRFRYP